MVTVVTRRPFNMGVPTWVILSCALLLPLCRGQKITDEAVAQAWLTDYNERAMSVYYKSVVASWNYNTNLTDYNQKLSVSTKLLWF